MVWAENNYKSFITPDAANVERFSLKIETADDKRAETYRGDSDRGVM